MVVAAHRDGGQAQFIERPVPRAETRRPRRPRHRACARPPRRAAHRRRPRASRPPLAAPARAPLPGGDGHEPRPLADRPARAGQPAAARVRAPRPSRRSRAPSASRPRATGGTSARGWGSARLRTGSGSARHGRQRADRGPDGADRRGPRARRAARRRSGTPSPPGRRASTSAGAGVPSTATRIADAERDPELARHRQHRGPGREARRRQRRGGGAVEARQREADADAGEDQAREQLGGVVRRGVGDAVRTRRCRSRTACSPSARSARAGRRGR